VRNGDLRLLSAGITRNIHLEAENGALREFVEQLQCRVGELQERTVELQERIVEVERISRTRPARIFASPILMPAARTATSTWPGPGSGRGTSRTSRTSIPP
jgi:hypothetical protein